MSRSELFFEFRKLLNEFARSASLRTLHAHIDGLFRMEASYDPREETLDGAYGIQRVLRNNVSGSTDVMTRFVAHVCRKIDMGEDEFDMSHSLVEMGPLSCKEAYTASCLVFYKRDEPSNQSERKKHDDEIGHGL